VNSNSIAGWGSHTLLLLVCCLAHGQQHAQPLQLDSALKAKRVLYLQAFEAWWPKTLAPCTMAFG
jgi:hypothetical protein